MTRKLRPQGGDASRPSSAISLLKRGDIKSKDQPINRGFLHIDETSANDKHTGGAALSQSSPAADAPDNPPPVAIAGDRAISSDTPTTSTTRIEAHPSHDTAPVPHNNAEGYALSSARREHDGTVGVTSRSLSPRIPTVASSEFRLITHPSPQRDPVYTPSESPLTDPDRVSLVSAQSQIEGYIDGTTSAPSLPPVTSSSCSDDGSQLIDPTPVNTQGFLSRFKRRFRSNAKPGHLAHPLRLKEALKNAPFLSWTNIFFLCVIPGWVLHFVKKDDPRFSTTIITCSSLSLLFFATLLEFVTDDLALRAGSTQAYLIWQRFDNSITVTFGILALRKGEVDLTLSILAGSVAANTLLIPGVALVVDSCHGGRVGSCMHQRDLPILTLSTFSLSISGVLSHAVDASQIGHNGHLVGNLIICVVAVGLTLVFLSAVYHRAREYARKDVDRIPRRRPRRKHRKHSQDLESGTEISQDQPHLSLACALLFLAILASSTAYTVEILTETINHSEDTIKLSTRLIGLVIVPVIRSIGDHLHITWSYEKNHIISTISMCLSSAQLLVSTILPIMVVVAWRRLQKLPHSTLLLPLTAVFCSVVVASQHKHLSGFAMVVMYIVIMTGIGLAGSAI